jgi:lipid-A-disaccharide synthase
VTTIFIVATETSGDIHGGNLARQLKAIDPTIRLVGVGGGHMREAGVEILIDPTAHATVGVFEAVRHINRYAKIYRCSRARCAPGCRTPWCSSIRPTSTCASRSASRTTASR